MKLFKTTPENCFKDIINFEYKTYYISGVLNDINYKDLKIAYIDENKSGTVNAGDTLIILTGLSTAGGLDASDFI